MAASARLAAAPPSAECKRLAHTRAGAELIGRRVRVLWATEKREYDGKVTRVCMLDDDMLHTPDLGLEARVGRRTLPYRVRVDLRGVHLNGGA